MTNDYVNAAYVPTQSTVMHAGHIDPPGELIYLTANYMGATGTGVYLARRIDIENWTMTPEVVTLVKNGTDPVLADGVTIGASTDPVHGKRRLVLSSATGFDEYIETTSETAFEYVASASLAALGVSFVREPSFSPSGLRVVFIGQSGTAIGVYTADRLTRDSAFGPARLLHVGTPQDQTPYLSDDCRHLYWSTSSVVHHTTAID